MTPPKRSAWPLFHSFFLNPSLINSSLLHQNVFKCSEVDCYNGDTKGSDYKGFESMTESGLDCQVWLFLKTNIYFHANPFQAQTLSSTFTNSHPLLWLNQGLNARFDNFIWFHATPLKHFHPLSHTFTNAHPPLLGLDCQVWLSFKYKYIIPSVLKHKHFHSLSLSPTLIHSYHLIRARLPVLTLFIDKFKIPSSLLKLKHFHPLSLSPTLIHSYILIRARLPGLTIYKV